MFWLLRPTFRKMYKLHVNPHRAQHPTRTRAAATAAVLGVVAIEHKVDVNRSHTLVGMPGPTIPLRPFDLALNFAQLLMTTFCTMALGLAFNLPWPLLPGSRRHAFQVKHPLAMQCCAKTPRFNVIS